MSGRRRGYRHTLLTATTLPMRGWWCVAHPVSSRHPPLSALTPVVTFYPVPSQSPAPYNVFRRQFLRFPDHTGSFGSVWLFLPAVWRTLVENHRICVLSVSRTTYRGQGLLLLTTCRHLTCTITALQRVPNAN